MKRIIGGAVIAAAALAAAGCGNIESSSFQNVPVSHTYQARAVRYDTPGHFPAVVLICSPSGTGIWVAESQGGAFALAHDPDCAQPAATTKAAKR